ncbi:hypothetical protein G9A89_022821 [Geosiphon pyriformis]|nr:hypothetical protein G9A89_022821 [Geosiphon pyriformis]
MPSSQKPPKKKESYAELRELRNSGLSRLQQYQIKEEEDLFEEVDEEYHACANEGGSENEFVEDDDGRGYIDNGFNHVEEHFSDEFSEDDLPKKEKRKLNKKAEKKEKQEPTRQLETYFQRGSTSKGIKRKPVVSSISQEIRKKNNTNSAEEDQDLLNTLFVYMDEDQEQEQPVCKKPKKESQVSFLDSKNTDYMDIENQDVHNYVSKAEPMKIIDHYHLEISHPPTNVEFKDKLRVEDERVETLGIKTYSAILDQKEHSENIKEYEETGVSLDPSTLNNVFTNTNPSIGVFDIADIVENDGTLKMFWLDAFENNGVLYLIGKVFSKAARHFVSCCVQVLGMERSVFFLPRAYRFEVNGIKTDHEVSMNDVFDELEIIRRRHKIAKWATKEVVRKYAFEIPDVPSEGNYLKAKYSFNFSRLPDNLSGETFSHVFGTNRSALELFIIQRKIMGPCWLNIIHPDFDKRQQSWCKIEAIVKDPKYINPSKEKEKPPFNDIPPLTIMSISLRTIMNPTKKVNEIVLASVSVYHNNETISEANLRPVQFTAIRPHGSTYPIGFKDLIKKKGFPLEIFMTERSLLNYLLAMIHRWDPDVLVGHNFIGFDLDVLLHRMKELRVEHWGRIGRLRRSVWPKLQIGAGGMNESTYDEKAVASGRLMCDTYLNARDLIKSKNYTLTELAQTQLNITRGDIEFSKVESYYQTPKELFDLIVHCQNDTRIASALMFKLQILPLTKQLTNLAGNLWQFSGEGIKFSVKIFITYTFRSKTLTGGRAERNEFILLHEFYNNRYICPDKQFGNVDRFKFSGQSGGNEQGLYDKYVLLLDFNSLYPSIIQEYNICFTTVQRDNLTDPDSVPDIPTSDRGKGILPKLLANLVERRKQVKKLMKDEGLTEARRFQYDIRQKAYKLTANSMYGCLGFAHSRFYARPLAVLITSKGREILQNTRELAESERMEVIYGDTDSIMINTNETDLKKVREMGFSFMKKVNERYKLLEIDMDGYFERLLLLKKKKYAAIKIEQNKDKVDKFLEMKGLDLVRRDWCELSQDASKYVLEQILSAADREEVLENIHKYLVGLGEKIRLGGFPVDKFIIYKNLTKAPEDYADGKIQPHVKVALRMKETGMGARIGETIPYVICKTGNVESNDLIANRAYHPKDDENSSAIGYFEWYLNTQIHPCVARLCEPIEGTDSMRIADCLGLDTSKFQTTFRSGNPYSTLSPSKTQQTEEERFVNVERFTLTCQNCNRKCLFEGLNSTKGCIVTPSGILCNSLECNQVLSRSFLITQLTRQVRLFIQRYYDGWLVCDEAACRNRTRILNGKKCSNPHCRGIMVEEYSDTMLYTQLLYLSTIFDMEKAVKKAKNNIPSGWAETPSEEISNLFAQLKSVVDQYLNKCGRRFLWLTYGFL